MLGTSSLQAMKNEFQNVKLFLEYVGVDKSIELLASKLAGTAKKLSKLEGDKCKYDAATGEWRIIKEKDDDDDDDDKCS